MPGPAGPSSPSEVTLLALTQTVVELAHTFTTVVETLAVLATDQQKKIQWRLPCLLVVMVGQLLGRIRLQCGARLGNVIDLVTFCSSDRWNFNAVR